ncbi:hypothetical protein DPMN_082310 [Dreissena polymorpha]|uniref:Uncharacterized protein n=1 Tax=Dreissena polymorpha TaxID=45954 RepID=A0A9D4BHC4_DREPO|nr:hypothetical protein DPMN_082310 [Dreissena polymorpha]
MVFWTFQPPILSSDPSHLQEDVVSKTWMVQWSVTDTLLQNRHLPPLLLYLWSLIDEPATKAPHSSTDPRVIQGRTGWPPIQTLSFPDCTYYKY